MDDEISARYGTVARVGIRGVEGLADMAGSLRKALMRISGLEYSMWILRWWYFELFIEKQLSQILFKEHPDTQCRCFRGNALHTTMPLLQYFGSKLGLFADDYCFTEPHVPHMLRPFLREL